MGRRGGLDVYRVPTVAQDRLVGLNPLVFEWGRAANRTGEMTIQDAAKLSRPFQEARERGFDGCWWTGFARKDCEDAAVQDGSGLDERGMWETAPGAKRLI